MILGNSTIDQLLQTYHRDLKAHRIASFRSSPCTRINSTHAAEISAVARSQQLICHLSGWPPLVDVGKNNPDVRFSDIASRIVIAGGGETESARRVGKGEKVERALKER